jgi:hypothetical protein
MIKSINSNGGSGAGGWPIPRLSLWQGLGAFAVALVALGLSSSAIFGLPSSLNSTNYLEPALQPSSDQDALPSAPSSDPDSNSGNSSSSNSSSNTGDANSIKSHSGSSDSGATSTKTTDSNVSSNSSTKPNDSSNSSNSSSGSSDTKCSGGVDCLVAWSNDNVASDAGPPPQKTSNNDSGSGGNSDTKPSSGSDSGASDSGCSGVLGCLVVGSNDNVPSFAGPPPQQKATDGSGSTSDDTMGSQPTTQ